MFDIKDYYKLENEKILNNYNNSCEFIKNIKIETDQYKDLGLKSGNNIKSYKFCNELSEFILKIADYENELSDNYFNTKSIDQLNQINNSFYKELFTDNYENSFANPGYSYKYFGNNTGQLFSYFYNLFRNHIDYANKHKIFEMEEKNRVFIELYNYIKEGEPDYEQLKEIVIKPVKEVDAEKQYNINLDERFNTDFKFYNDIIENPDLSDLRYLYRYGKYISEYELKTAEFINNYPEEQISLISRIIVNAYFDGFKRDNKKTGMRNNIELIFKIGQERIYRRVIKELKKRGMNCLVTGCMSTSINLQYNFDHKFDLSLFLDKEYVEKRVDSYNRALMNKDNLMSGYSGVIAVFSFGEPPFSPENKYENLKFSLEQKKIYQIYNNRMNKAYYEHVPREKTSYCVIAFPSPEIGKNYTEIFEDTFKINTLDPDKYMKIQQRIINVLDKADYVHVKGKDGNLTDIKVKLQELKDPHKESLFENCGANLNIPVGEVFTTPQLTGTNGILHIGETYLRGLRYDNLKITFKNGYITDYSCTNYAEIEENKKYIKENLLFPHDTLPIGEFAIGTNTYAYAVAKKYNIINKLPILIIEKMGPHFAVGDTCFQRREDHKVFNLLDNKEITARDNEKSLLRKTNPDKAYTNVHTDISLPYEEIGFISAVNNSDSTDIIRNGRFVLKGTEELNIPLDNI